MASTHFDYEQYDEESYAEVSMCGTRLGENYEYSNNWNYVSCKKCLKKRSEIESELSDINKHRSEQDGDFVEFMISEGIYPKAQ